MDRGLRLVINGMDAILNNDTSISISRNNQLFSKRTDFSFPFELPFSPNRHLFGNMDMIEGDSPLKSLDGVSAIIYYDGIPLYKGVIETEGGTEIKETIPFSVVSGKGTFEDMISGMNGTDVPLKDEIYIGTYVEGSEIHVSQNESFMLWHDSDATLSSYKLNISDPYPIAKYCNVRVCYKHPDKDEYITLDAKRPWSGMCFYVLYFMECLFTHLGISYDLSSITKVEDLNRLAFFTTKCKYKNGKVKEGISYDLPAGPYYTYFHGLKPTSAKPINTGAYATSENFPTESVSGILESLESAFGIRFIFDEENVSVKAVLLKDIFSDKEVVRLNCIVHSKYPKSEKINGVKIQYSASSDEDNTSFNYDDYSKVVIKDNYKDIVKEVTVFNNNLYIDDTTGDKYRIKADKDADSKETMYPALFEVGQYNQVDKGDVSDEDFTEEITIGFNPVEVNDVNYKNEIMGLSDEQELAVFIDVDMKAPEDISRKEKGPAVMTHQYHKEENYDMSVYAESPLRNYDAGFTLGIMRGPGSASKIDIVTYNYDGENNDRWVQTPGNYAFTSDSIDNYGKVFDYNGEESGGVDLSGRISLKIAVNNKDYTSNSTYAKRGLYDQFLSEYVHFLLNRKILVVEVSIEVAELANIDMTRKYLIGEDAGYINSISYTVGGDNKIIHATIELFVI